MWIKHILSIFPQYLYVLGIFFQKLDLIFLGTSFWVLIFQQFSLTTWFSTGGDDKTQQQVSGAPEDKIQVKVFLVDSGRTVLTGPENIRQLPEQLRQEFTTIKYLAFLFHLKVNKLFSKNGRNMKLLIQTLADPLSFQLQGCKSCTFILKKGQIKHLKKSSFLP
jgi:hypothetical protein